MHYHGNECDKEDSDSDGDIESFQPCRVGVEVDGAHVARHRGEEVVSEQVDANDEGGWPGEGVHEVDQERRRQAARRQEGVEHVAGKHEVPDLQKSAYSHFSQFQLGCVFEIRIA